MLTGRGLPITGAQVVMAVVLALACYFAIKFVQAAGEAQQVDQRAARIIEANRRLEDENRQLQAELRRVQSDDFVEREARDKLGLVKPGDVPFVVHYPTPTPR